MRTKKESDVLVALNTIFILLFAAHFAAQAVFDMKLCSVHLMSRVERK